MSFELTVAIKSNPKSKTYDRIVYGYSTDNINYAKDEYIRIWDKYPKAHIVLEDNFGIVNERWTE